MLQTIKAKAASPPPSLKERDGGLDVKADFSGLVAQMSQNLPTPSANPTQARDSGKSETPVRPSSPRTDPSDTNPREAERSTRAPLREETTRQAQQARSPRPEGEEREPRSEPDSEDPQAPSGEAPQEAAQSQASAQTAPAPSPLPTLPENPQAANPASLPGTSPKPQGLAPTGAASAQNGTAPPPAAAPTGTATGESQGIPAAQAHQELEGIAGGKLDMGSAPASTQLPQETSAPLEIQPSKPLINALAIKGAPAPETPQAAQPLPATSGLPSPQPLPTGKEALLAVQKPENAHSTTESGTGSSSAIPSISLGLGGPSAPASTGAVASSASAQETSLPRPSQAFSQVEGTIRWMIQNQDKSAELQLHPESLGRVFIKIDVNGTEVHAKVWASDASTLPVLQEHRGHLEAALREQGLSLGSYDLHQGHRGEDAQNMARQSFASTPLPTHAPSETQQELPIAPASYMLGASRIEVLA